MAVKTKLGIERKVAAELEKERPEVAIECIDVIVVHHRGGTHNPWIRLTGLRTAPAFSAEYGGLFLGLADKKNSFVLPKLAQVLFHHIVFALSLMELYQRYLMLRHKLLQLRNKLPAHRLHQGGRGQRIPTTMTEKSSST